MLQKLKMCSVVFALWAIGTSVAHAMLMDFEFDVTFDTGPLMTQEFTGTFTLDGYTGTGNEKFAPAGSTLLGLTGTLTAFNIGIDVATFTLADDRRFPDFPEIQFTAGKLTVMDYMTWGVHHIEDFLIHFFLPSTNYVHTDNEDDESSYGRVTRVAPVPLPAAVWLFGAGLLGLVGVARRKKAA